MAFEDDLNFLSEAIENHPLPALISCAREAWNTGRAPYEKSAISGIFLSRAMELGIPAYNTLSDLFKKLQEEDKEKERRQKAQAAKLTAETFPAYLEPDKNGKPMPTVFNYNMIMNYDLHYQGIKFNLLKNQAEQHKKQEDGSVLLLPWTNADDAESISYIEKEYHIYSDTKHAKALAMLFREREYNPVLDIVEQLNWDGKERIQDFLIQWMKVEDTPYSREISRLIFAGGINRLYNPGCKFDDVPVLIGTKQGEGKSTICRWLAIDDTYYTDITQFEGTQAIEQLEGAWVCEIGELLALNRAKDQEGVKSFITRQHDKYRKPYEPNTSVLPRRCIFIATTNSPNFLKDKSGNRRFYPIEVHSTGYDLYQHEAEVREYIRQCWAEAREKYKAGKMPSYADHALLDVYRSAQAEAMEDDWREGALADYLRRMHIGERVCCRQIMREALTLPGDLPRDPSKKESMEITQMMTKMPGWERYKDKQRCGTYAKQRGWVKVASESEERDSSCGNDPLDL